MRTSPSGDRRSRRPLILTAAATAAAAALLLAGCSGTTTDPAAEPSASGDSSLRIAFSPFNMQIPAFQGLAAGLTAAAEGMGDTVTTADPKGDPSTQLQQIQQWVELDQIDALWVIPAAADAVAPAIQAALDKGIVVVAAGVPDDYGMSEDTPGITFTNVDNVDYGTKLGELTAQCIDERLDGKGQVIFLQSPVGAQSTAEINDTFLSVLADQSPDSEVVNQQDAQDRLGSQQTVLSVLQGSPDANTLTATDDESTLGGVDAFTQAGKDPSSLCIIGAGGNDEAVQAVEDGKVYADIAFDFEADLMQNLTQLHTMAEDPTAPGGQLTTPIKVIQK
ncbi:sugar ABC transporter substrate-binding protein [Agromyces sp. MMS24-JH15]|uniref:sugar ABC transporter substrate-binding protein n=1 Tax=Agromyces sp. MMS24-JH15 TaxID=3243765 RepID=UPI0037495EFB